MDYTNLDTKWSHNVELNQNYKLGQQYKLTSETPYCVIELIVDSILDYVKQKQVAPENKLIIENHKQIILTTLRNLNDLKITVDYKDLLCIIDGIIYANGKHLYRKDSR
mgnify:CR=1 FL=1